MFEAKGIKLEEIEPQDEMKDATGAGRGYGVAGGVAAAIEECIREYYPDVDVNIEHAESLAECKKMLMLAKMGKKNGCNFCFKRIITIFLQIGINCQIDIITCDRIFGIDHFY